MSSMMRIATRQIESKGEPPAKSALASLLNALPERYQPIYGHAELSASASRDSSDRLAEVVSIYDRISEFLRRPLRVLDLGCAQGFFSLHLAARGATVHGVDLLASNIAVCKALAEENSGFRITFEVGQIEAIIERLRVDDYDLVLGLSVFHHLTFERGVPAVREMLSTLARKVGAGIFEMAVREEPVYWSVALPASPRELLQGFSFVHRTAEYGTHVSDIRRPLYVASNRYWLLGDQIGAFDRFTTESHRRARGLFADTRLYYFGAGRLVKVYLLDNPWKREKNLSEIRTETAFLRREIENFRKPRLLLADEHRDEAWLVRECLDGELLCDIMHEGWSCDPEALLDEILDQLVALESAGLYHGDVRTWNILVDPSGHATLIDYGDLSDKPADCTQPHNIFLSFMLLVREICTGEPRRAHRAALPTFSPDELPDPYRSAFWSMLARPPEHWSFARLRKDFRARKKLPRRNVPGQPALRVIFGALEECGDTLDRTFAEGARQIQQLETLASRAAARETELNVTLAARAVDIQQLQDRAGQAEARATELGSAIATRDAAIATRDAAIAGLQQRERALNEAVREAETRTSDLSSKLAAQAAEALQLTDRIHQLESARTEMEKALSARDAQLAALGARLQVSEANMSSATAGIARTQDALAQNQAENDRLRETIAERDTSIQAAAAVEGSLRQHIGAMNRSTSWRVTLPLRIIGGRLNRLKQRFAGKR